MAVMPAGQAVVECLRAEGVQYLYGLVGSAYLEILDALYGSEDLQFVGTRHEQGAVFMALGYAMASGQPTVCIAQNGPGVTNLITGVAAAYRVHAPMVVLAPAPMLQDYYRDSLQELDHVSIFRTVTKMTAQINKASRIPELIRDAFRVATAGKMGPALLDIPRDLLNEKEVEVELLPPERSRPSQRPEGDLRRVSGGVELVKGSKFPVILAGGGAVWSGAGEDVVRLAELVGAPIVATYGRNDVVPSKNPMYIGHLGRGGAPEAEEAMRKADVILAIGTRLPHPTTFYDNRYIPRDARILQVEIDQREIGRNYPVAVGIVGDASAVTRALVRGLEAAGEFPGKEQRLRQIAELREKRRKRRESDGERATMPMKPQRAFYELRKAMPDDAALVFDAGGCTAFGFDALEYNRPRSFFDTIDLACIGSGFPLGLGVKMAMPERPVVSIGGDGGFFMNAQELMTAVEWKIPLVTVVMNNNGWGSEKAYQKVLYGERYIGANLTNPRYDRLAELCGAKGFYVDRPQEIGEALEAALKSGEPSVIEIPVDPDELPYPTRAADVFKDIGKKG